MCCSVLQPIQMRLQDFGWQVRCGNNPQLHLNLPLSHTILPSDISCWCGGNSWKEHFLLMRWEFMKSNHFLLMRWEFMKSNHFLLMHWELMKATFHAYAVGIHEIKSFPADAVGIHEINIISCWCSWNSWNQHHFLLMQWEFMKTFKATSFLLMLWEYMLMLGIVRRVRIFYFVPLLTLLVCLFLRNLGRCCRQKRFLQSRRTTDEVNIAPCRLRSLDYQTDGWSGLVDGSRPEGCSCCCLPLGNKHPEGPKQESVSGCRCSSSRPAAAAADQSEPAYPGPGEEIS